jgi:hypothetical protein
MMRTLTGVPLKGLVVAALIAAVVVPAASAKSAARVKLSVLPLPASSIGPAATSLSLQSDSGLAPNTDAGRRGQLLTPTHSLAVLSASHLVKLGRISGYKLDYGLGASGGAGVTEVWTSVDEYKASAGAKKGLAFWKLIDGRGFPQYDHGGLGLAVVHKALKVAAVGSGRFAFFVGFSAANIAPVFGVDEQFTEGRYEADVMVWAGTAAAAKKLAPTLAKKLDARIKQALAGRLHATPVKLPPKQKPGPPIGGPDLGALALHASDVSPPGTVFGSYLVDPIDPTARSTLMVTMNPAGQFDQFTQEIEWCPTANQASFMADFLTANALTVGGSVISQLDLGGIGDGARGWIANNSGGGAAQVVFSSGQLLEILLVTSQNGVQASDAQKLAQTAANYINAAGLGS